VLRLKFVHNKIGCDRSDGRSPYERLRCSVVVFDIAFDPVVRRPRNDIS
jgi:hypothetical protein